MSYAYATTHSLGGLGASAAPGDVELAAQADIPLDILLAIRQIESGANPRAVRFEPHVFHRKTSNRYVGTIPGNPGEVSRVRSYTDRAAFERARGHDERAAIESTSWGLFQVLGGHLLRKHPSNPVGAFDGNPEHVSKELLVSWFEGNPMAKAAAQRHDIEELARRYNGSTRWRDRVTEALERIRRDGIEVVDGGFRVDPISAVGVAAVSVAAIFTGWAYWKYGRA